MLKNYSKVALRNMLRQKGYTVLNLIGLAIGISVCMIIILFVNSELNFDNFHKKGDRIYRVVLDRRYPGRSTSYAIIPYSIGDAMKKEFPEIEQSVRLFQGQQDQGLFLRVDDKVFNEKNVLFADSNFFDVFTVPLLLGNASKALTLPNSLVVNESTAKKYFGSAANALGKTITVDDSAAVVTAVSKDLPPNSHFTFDVIASLSSFGNGVQKPDYVSFSCYNYLLLNANADAKALERKFPLIIEKYVSGDIEKNFGVSFKEFQSAGNGYHYYLQPLTKIHLTSNLEAELSPNGSINIVYAFSVIAFFILLLACINFINLSTARSLDRAKEVGIRKTFGSEQSALIRQFLFESVITSVLSLVIAIILIFVILPFFNGLFNLHLSALYFFQPLQFTFLILSVIFIGVLAGLYPAFVLSSFKPIIVLKGKFSFNPKGRLVRNGLVIFQFAISVMLIISTLTVDRQMQYMLSDQLGFRKDNIVELQRTDLLGKQSQSFINDLRKIPGIENVSGTSALPGDQNFFGASFQLLGSKETLTGRGILSDDQLLSTLDIPVVKGRFFSRDLATDSLSILLNEKALAELGIADPIGARLISPDGFFNLPDGTTQVLTVIGIVKDFNFQSLHQKITPLIFMNGAKFKNVLPLTAVRIQSSQIRNVLGTIEKDWNSYVPGHPFQYKFLDQQLASLYHSEQTMEKLFKIFSMLAIFIAFIGLLGLVTYAAQKRAREIGIRRVLGASVSNIITLLSKDFLKLVIIAVLVAFPVAWLGMDKWLQDFAYRVNVSWWIFIISAFIAVAMALLTVGFQAVKAAITNPVTSLRTE
ncbi:MAG: ABC transporter permease [Chitinophagales bacterium]|nr:ABC transporter permease [Chitinophagales bacterium]